MQQIAAKFVPQLSNDEQKENPANTCQDLQEKLERDPEFLSKIITGDETWVYSYNPETKQESPQWKSQSPPCSKRQNKFTPT
jgi:hypothetical protein